MFQNQSFQLPQQSGMTPPAQRPGEPIMQGGGGMMPQQPAQPYQPQMSAAPQHYAMPQPYAGGGGGFGQPQQNPQQNLLAMLQRMQGGGMGGSMPQPQPGMMGGTGGYNPNQQVVSGGTGGFNQNGQLGGQPQVSNLLSMLFGGR